MDESKAAEYRHTARLCLELAERMSLREDRGRILEMAQRWFALAAQVEAESRDEPGETERNRA